MTEFEIDSFILYSFQDETKAEVKGKDGKRYDIKDGVIYTFENEKIRELTEEELSFLNFLFEKKKEHEDSHIPEAVSGVVFGLPFEYIAKWDK